VPEGLAWLLLDGVVVIQCCDDDVSWVVGICVSVVGQTDGNFKI
jgi:hypothetical protein